MKTFVFRLKPKQDLKIELQKFVTENNINAGSILTCVGSLRRAHLRMAGAKNIKTFVGKQEIVSLVGTLTQCGLHLHISLSDENGNVVGGHLKNGCIINGTAEMVIAEIENLVFSRELDKQTGYKELVVSKK